MLRLQVEVAGLRFQLDNLAFEARGLRTAALLDGADFDALRGEKRQQQQQHEQHQQHLQQQHEEQQQQQQQQHEQQQLHLRQQHGGQQQQLQQRHELQQQQQQQRHAAQLVEVATGAKEVEQARLQARVHPVLLDMRRDLRQEQERRRRLEAEVEDMRHLVWEMMDALPPRSRRRFI